MAFKIDLNQTFGAAFIGMVVAAILYGVTLLQTYNYYTLFPEDHIALRTMVAVLWALDTLSLGFVCRGVYTYLVTDFSNPIALLDTLWTITAEPAISGAVAFIAHAYLGSRVWRICGRPLILGIALTLLSTLALADSIVAVVNAMQFKVWTNTPELRWKAFVGDVTTAILDLIIAAVLSVYLWRAEVFSRGGNHTVRTLLLYTINTGILTTVMSLLDLISVSTCFVSLALTASCRTSRSDSAAPSTA